MTTHKSKAYLGLLLLTILFLFGFARFYICFKEWKGLDEDFAYLFYLEPSSAKGLAKECCSQGIDCETWMIGMEENLRAEGLAHTAFGYVVQVEGGRLEALCQNISEPSCVVSSRLAGTLFGSEHVTGKHILYQGTSYAITCTIPDEMPILFLCQSALVQLKETSPTSRQTQHFSTDPASMKKNAADSPATEDFQAKLSIAVIRGTKALDYQKTENLFRNSDAKIDVNLLKWMVFPAEKGFPLWSLPGKWSDLKGWGTLWDAVKTQITMIARFRDYPILCRYYHCMAGCTFYLLLCFLCLLVFLRTAH